MKKKITAVRITFPNGNTPYVTFFRGAGAGEITTSARDISAKRAEQITDMCRLGTRCLPYIHAETPECRGYIHLSFSSR